MNIDSGKKVGLVIPKMPAKAPTVRRPRVFLDSAPKDYTTAKYVEKKLREQGLEVEEFSRARKLLLDPLQTAVDLLRGCDASVFLATPNSIRDDWVLAELGGAIASEHPLVVLTSGVGRADLPAPFLRAEIVGFNRLDGLVQRLARTLAEPQHSDSKPLPKSTHLLASR
jgi:hypothetical protein